MGIMIWVILGAVVGWLASMLVGTNQGILMNIAVGIIGSLLGGWIMKLFGQNGVDGFNIYSFFVALTGAIVFLSAIKTIRTGV